MNQSDYDLVYGLGKTWTQDLIRLGFGLHSTYLKQAAKFSRSPLEVMLGRDYLVNKVELAIERKAFASKRLKAVITNSAMVKQDVIEQYNFPEQNIHVIYNGVDLERFTPDNKNRYREATRRELGLSADDFVLLFLGTNYGRKGLDRLILALPEIVKIYPEVKVLVVGYGHRIEEFRSMATKHNVEQHLVFVGGRRDIEAMYTASDLFVLPTRFDPFANTSIEALACGLPIITTKENGAHEVVENRKDGSVLVDSDSVDNMIEELDYWIQCVQTNKVNNLPRLKAEQHSILQKMQQLSDVVESLR